MSKLQAYNWGHFRITVPHPPLHTMSDEWWVKFIDAVGIWTVPVED